LAPSKRKRTFSTSFASIAANSAASLAVYISRAFTAGNPPDGSEQVNTGKFCPAD
jgi:hypothetical protein